MGTADIFLPHHLVQMRRRILKDEFYISFIFEKEMLQLKAMLNHTLVDGESNSMLMIGHRGSGKSLLLNKVLSSYDGKNFLRIYLNGLVHTDDRLSLDEITRQMSLEETKQMIFYNFSDNFQFLLNSFKAGNKSTIPIVFVLDEFDMFCQHKNQTLLYNLFDIVQSTQMSIAVIGLTVRLDAMELLEKRVKSRFSHRIIHLCPSYSYEEYMNIVRSILSFEACEGDATMEEWNRQVDCIVSDKTVRDIFKKQYNLDKSLQTLKMLLLQPILGLTKGTYLIKAGDIITSFNRLNNVDSKSCLLIGLTILEICLIIAMNNLTISFDSEPFNFEMVFRSYQRFCQTKSSVQMFERAIVAKAFEHLVELEIVQAEQLSGKGDCMLKDFRPMRLMVDSVDISNALQQYQGCPTDVKQWANNIII